MIIIITQIASWAPSYELKQMRGGYPIPLDKFQVGDKIVVKTDLGVDLTQIVKIEEKTEEESALAKTVPAEGEESAAESGNFILRKAGQEDLDKYAEKNKIRDEAMKKCEEMVKKRKLAMKIIDVLFSLDGGRVTFAFTAPGRMDFRELVKDLAQEFHKSIRLYQVGARQETGLVGDIGPCGRPLCCQFLKKLGSVTTEFIYNQQLSHRGPERLTGVCGRLKCCLVFEQEMYQELAKNLPALGSQIKTAKGEGKVVGQYILKQSVVIELKDGIKVEVPVADLKT